MPQKTLILCIDRDADLKEKVGISGPVIGRSFNLDAANKLLLADPEEVDGNTIFEAVKLFDTMKSNGEDVEIATLTGDSSRGYVADREISNQLDKVLSEYPAESCIVVTDGADDEQIIPLVNSRMRIDSVRIISMKQSKELERTYFLILEKLKEPYFARTFIGIPAIILILLSVSYWLGFEWKPVATLLGLYLLAKGFGIEDRVISILSHFKLSAEQVSSITYVLALPLFGLAIWISLEEYMRSLVMYDVLKSLGYAIRSLVIFIIPPTALLYVGQLYDSLRVSNMLSTARMLFYLVLSGVILYIAWMFASWVAAEVYFREFVDALIISIIFGAISMEAMQYFKREIIRGVDLLGKEVYSSSGSYLGKVVSVDDDEKVFVYVNQWKKRQTCDYNLIKDVDSRITLV